MDPITKDRKTNDLFSPDVSSRSIVVRNDSQELERIRTEALEPSIWRTLGRLLHEFIFIAFFIGIHWLIKQVLIRTQQEHEWWAIYLLYVSIIYAAIAFTIIFGAELIVDCKRAVQSAIRRIREE
jgi:hypothetical protein